MAEPTTTGPKRRLRRSTRVSQQLARMREANAVQRAELLAQEQRVDEALQEFAEAEGQIQVIDAACEAKVDQLHKLRSSARDEVAAQRARQASAALVIRSADRTVAEVGDVRKLGNSQSETRRRGG